MTPLLMSMQYLPFLFRTAQRAEVEYNKGVMKIFLFALFFTLFGMANASESDCLSRETKSPLEQKALNDIQNILTSTTFSLREKQKAFDKLNSDNAQTYFSHLAPADQKNLTDLIEKIKNSKEPLVQIVDNEGDPVLFVNGIDFREFPHEWIQPFQKLLTKKQLSYFFKWDKFNSIEKNRDDLVKTIKELHEKYPDKKLTVVGYSAGGVITLLAIDTLTDENISNNVIAHTVASPLFGYRAPLLAMIGAPFVGKSSIQIGRGNSDKLTHKKLNNCHHWTTTNCEMDQHTCENDKLNPQLGMNSTGSDLPCGNDNITKLNDESHASVLNRVFDEIVK